MKWLRAYGEARWRYVFAVLMVASAAVIRLTCLGILGTRLPFVTFYPAVTLAALYGGLPAGILATAISIPLASWLWIEPKGATYIFMDRVDLAAFSVYLVSCLVVSIACEARLRSQARARKAMAEAAEARANLRSQEEMLRLNRTLKALGNSRKALAVADSEAEYLNAVCRLVVENCGHAMVWVGYAEEGADKSIRPVAQSGFEDGFLDSLHLTWADTEQGQGPAGTAIRTGKPAFCRDMLTDPAFGPWREEAAELGYGSAAALPLLSCGKAFGALVVYAKDKNLFLDEEIELLSELAEDIVRGAIALRLREANGKAQEALRQSEERYRGLVELSPEAIVINRDNRFVFFNPAALRLLGAASTEQVLGKSPFEVFCLESHALIRERIEALQKGQAVPFLEEKLRRLDGTVRDVEVAATPFKDGEGQAIQLIIRDITERKLVEERLRRQAEEMEALMELAPVAIWIGHDPECRRITGNRMGNAFYEAQPGENVSAWPPPGEPPSPRRFFRDGRELKPEELTMQYAALNGVDVRNSELEVLLPSGQRIFMLGSASPLRDSEGRVRGCLAAFLNITERKSFEEALRLAKEAAEEASKAKDRFLAVLSHELRTPLTPVLAAVLMLQREPTDERRLQSTLELIRRNVEMEARLIDDLLDLTRISRGKTELDKRPTDLSTVIHRAVEVCLPDINARRLDLSVDLGEGAYPIKADAGRLQQVFWNLLRNAVKFTPPGGRVEIRCRREGGNEAVVEVIDNGEGIAPETIPRLFNAFEQGEPGTTRQFGGLGLGLVISRSFTEMHGGSIEAFSEGKGKGATFRVRLPLASVGSAKEQESVAPSSAAPLPAVQPLRILYVEDHGDTAEMMRDLLQYEGHRVQTAGDVATAVELATNEGFDLMISDLGLPDGSGIDLMRQLRARGVSMPGIALSGYGQEQDVRESLQAGFAMHIVKPVGVDQLLDALAQVVRSPAMDTSVEGRTGFRV
jgi:PAS domain S-box-containing protein